MVLHLTEHQPDRIRLLHTRQNNFPHLSVPLHQVLNFGFTLLASPCTHTLDPKAYLPLAGTRSYSSLSHPAGFGRCLHPTHPATRSFLRESKDRLPFFTRASINECDCHMITSVLLIIHFWSRSKPLNGGGLARSRSDPHKSAYAKTHTSADRVKPDPILIRLRLSADRP